MKQSLNGFTLIELSVVLVIVGLILGGVLVGQNLIQSAAVRAQLTQIEQLNTAVNTFRGKYGYLPGDIPPSAVKLFGFSVLPIRPGGAGQGDGNGLVEGYAYNNATVCDWCGGEGETAWFWEDLTSNTALWAGGFNYATTSIMPTLTNSGSPSIKSILPPSKLGGTIYLYIAALNSRNYIGLSSIYELDTNGDALSNGGGPGLTVAQAYALDRKIDDGFPQTGNVVALWEAFDLGGFPIWAGTNQNTNGAPYTTATTGSASTCFDNGGSAGSTQRYSLGISNGSNVNCALWFQLQ